MKNMCLLPVWAVLLIIAGTFFSCEKKKDMAIYRQADSLNLLSYRMRYKNLDTACKAAHDAYKLADGFPSLRAGALNNQGFCAFIHMDFEKAEDLFLRVYEESNNELECLIADIGMMKICQRTAMNKEFYDYRNSALRRMKRISDDRSAITDPGELERLNYARSEFSIASAIYYYYLQQEQQSLEAINEIKVDEALESDTAQLLYYYYMKGSGGMYEADTPQDVVLGEFNYLIECLGISREHGYIYFEANASQAMAELLKERKNFDLIMERRPNVMRASKGIIDKYKKTNEIFRVCLFRIESELGKGSRFYFRLPKGVRKTLMLVLVAFLPVLTGCNEGREKDGKAEQLTLNDSIQRYDKLLAVANEYAYDVYNCNIDGLYQQALCYADSALYCLNKHYIMYSGSKGPLLELEGEGAAADLDWFNRHFDTDYYALLDVRNEAAVAFLALGNLEAYRYNNNAYTALYKQISEDTSLEQYCRQMQLSANNKTVAIILCVVILLVLLVGYYILYFRHRLIYRYNLEQVLEINKQVFSASLLDGRTDRDIAASLVNDMFETVNELLPIDVLGVAVYSEDSHSLNYAFSPVEDENEEMREMMARSFDAKTPYWREKDRVKCLPLWVEAGNENRCTGVLALKIALPVEREDDRLMLELVAGYVAIIVYNAVVLMAQKYRDIESAYYPNRIKQIIDRLNTRQAGENEAVQVETIGELISYYKDIFTLLSSCAARQLEEITFRRGVVKAGELADYAARYIKRAGKRMPHRVELRTEVEHVSVLGDVIQLKFMLENLIDEALSYEVDGILELCIYKDKDFVRFDFRDTRREKSQEELNLLFYPHLSRMKQGQEGVLTGTEYLICKQVIRDHDEFAGRRGCRINAQPAVEGGFTVWFTLPAR